MATYKLQYDKGIACGVIKDGVSAIPLCEDNKDYQAYLKWLAEGNTPELADPLPTPTPEQIYEEQITAKMVEISDRELRVKAIAEIEAENVAEK